MFAFALGRRARLLVLIGFLPGLVGCSAGRVGMVVPAPLTAAPPLEVARKQGFRQSYRFGEFATSRVRLGWTSTFSWPVPVGGPMTPLPAWFEPSRTRRRFSFELQPVAGTVWQVRGAYAENAAAVALGATAGSTASLGLYREELYSSVMQAEGQPTWQLVLRSENRLGNRPQFAQGTLSSGDSVLQVRPLNQLLRRDGRPLTLPFGVPVGYEFVRTNGSVVAAVELLGRGRVWLAPGLAPQVQGPVAAAVTSLLLTIDGQ